MTTKQVRFRKGTTAEHANFIGAIAEVTVDTTKNTLRVHDNTTTGGHVIATEAFVNGVFDGVVDLINAGGSGGGVGPQGPAGPTGATGPQGPQGATGPQGPAGPIGATGPQGPAGQGSNNPADRLVNGDLEAILDASGTLNTPLLIPTQFTAVLDSGHMTRNVGLTDTPWQFEVQFQVDQNGSVQTMMDNPFPNPVNPGYISGDEFTFVEADHGIPGYTFTLVVNDVVLPGGAGWTANVAVSQPPAYPSTVKSLGAIKLTADTKSWTLGTDGFVTLPGGAKITTNGTSVDLVPGAEGYAELASNNGDNYVWVDDNGAYIVTNAVNSFKQWTFGEDGNLALPVGGDIVDSEGASVLVPGPQGPAGPIGATGPQGDPGPTGATGATGPQGEQGVAGNNGSPGSQGEPGPAGATGATGPQGAAGLQGLQGPAGPQGNKGDTGEQGVSVTLKGTKALIADLPNSGQTAGDAWIVTESNGGDLFFWNVTEGTWDNVGKIVGPQGNPGIQGPQGEQGPPGNDGAEGPTGATGPQGETGATGPQGDTGPQGVPGSTGAQGNDGPMGPPGNDGPMGPPGSTWLSSTGLAPQPGINPGDQYLDSDTGNVYQWDGETWIYTGNIKGPAGADGSAGFDQSVNTSDAVQFNGLTLTKGDGADGSNGFVQARFTYNGSTEFEHQIRTRHNDQDYAGNAFDFYTNANQVVEGSPQTNDPVHGLTIQSGSVGINGITNPQYTLDVSGDAGVDNLQVKSGGGVQFNDYSSQITESRPGSSYTFPAVNTVAVTGAGLDAKLNVQFAAGDPEYGVTTNDGGTYTYFVGDQLKVTGDLLGGTTPANDLIVEVTATYFDVAPGAVYSVAVVSGTPPTYIDGLHIRNNNNEWTFGETGDLVLRQGGIKFADGTLQTTASSSSSNADSITNNGYSLSIQSDGAVQLPNFVKQHTHGSVTCNSGIDTVIYTGSNQYQHTFKLLLKVEGHETNPSEPFDTQSTEMIIAKSFRSNTVVASVYGVVHTSVAPLATFTAQWNPSINRVEVLCRPTSLTYGVEVRTFATEIATSD